MFISFFQTRIKNQESRIKNQESRIKNQESRIREYRPSRKRTKESSLFLLSFFPSLCLACNTLILQESSGTQSRRPDEDEGSDEQENDPQQDHGGDDADRHEGDMTDVVDEGPPRLQVLLLVAGLRRVAVDVDDGDVAREVAHHGPEGVLGST